ncbi:MAG: hypothetical protein AB4352_22905 [Hormoscilla sp.]
MNVENLIRVRPSTELTELFQSPGSPPRASKACFAVIHSGKSEGDRGDGAGGEAVLVRDCSGRSDSVRSRSGCVGAGVFSGQGRTVRGDQTLFDRDRAVSVPVFPQLQGGDNRDRAADRKPVQWTVAAILVPVHRQSQSVILWAIELIPPCFGY